MPGEHATPAAVIKAGDLPMSRALGRHLWAGELLVEAKDCVGRRTFGDAWRIIAAPTPSNPTTPRGRTSGGRRSKRRSPGPRPAADSRPDVVPGRLTSPAKNSRAAGPGVNSIPRRVASCRQPGLHRLPAPPRTRRGVAGPEQRDRPEADVGGSHEPVGSADPGPIHCGDQPLLTPSVCRTETRKEPVFSMVTSGERGPLRMRTQPPRKLLGKTHSTGDIR
jgi:hypothetical protein